MPLTSHGLSADSIHAQIKLLINNLVNIKDTSGEFLLTLDDGRVIDTKGWYDWEWTHGVGLYGLWQYNILTGSKPALDVVKEWFANRLAEGTTKNINTMAVFLTLAYSYEGTRGRTYLPWLEEWGEWARYDLSRTPSGGMQHITYASLNTNELWDDTLMTVLPLAKIGKLLERPQHVEEAKQQFLTHIQFLFDTSTGLWFHGWKFDEGESSMLGHNVARAGWARGNSWVTMVIPGVSGNVGPGKRLQAPSGMWRTLLDVPEEEGSYIEASATAGFAYGMLKAVRKRYIGREDQDPAIRAIKAVPSRISE